MIKTEYIITFLIIIFYGISLIVTYNLGKQHEKIIQLENPVIIKDTTTTFHFQKPATSEPSDTTYGKADSSKPAIKPSVLFYRTELDTVLSQDTLHIKLFTDLPVKGVWDITLKHTLKLKTINVYVPESLSWYEKPYFNFLAGFLAAILTIIFL